MELYEALEDRRSIRKYTADPVSDETLQKLLRAAGIAPSWKNNQCWRFIIVREQSRKQKLAGSLPDGNPCKKAIAEMCIRDSGPSHLLRQPPPQA